MTEIPAMCQACLGIQLLENLNMTTNGQILSSLAQKVAAQRLNSDTPLKELVTAEIVLNPPCATNLNLVLLWNNWLWNHLDPQEMYCLANDHIFLGRVDKDKDPYADKPEAISSPTACELGIFKRYSEFDKVNTAARNLRRLHKA